MVEVLHWRILSKRGLGVSKTFPPSYQEQINALNLGKAYLVNFNLVPLVALAIATPKLMLRKRTSLVYASIGIGGIALQLIIWFVIIISAFNSTFLVCRVSPSS